MFRICLYQLKQSFLSPRFYAALLIGIVVQLITTVPLCEFANSISEPLSLVDGFLFFNSDFFSIAAASLGTVLLVADIPFTSQNETYTLLRTTRIKWILGKSIYLFISCAIYYLIMFIVSALYIAENAYMKDIWSQPMYILSQDTSGQYLSEFGVYYRYGYLFTEFTPFQAFLTSYSLSISYAFLLSLFIFLLNLKITAAIGYFIAVMYHFLNYFMVTIFPTSVMQKYSLLAYTSLTYHQYNTFEGSNYLLSIPESYAILLAVSLCLFTMVLFAVKRYDFKITVGTKQ